jgi:UDP-galactopyranose mutase
MNTFYQLWKTTTPDEAKKIIDNQIKRLETLIPKNLEEQALKLIGHDLYNLFIKGYTEKQWGRDATTVPAFIIRRIPIRYTFNNNYFDDIYQGIPAGGYNLLINKLLEGIEVKLNTNFFEDKAYFENIANKIIYTGRIDEFYNYTYGKLEYRSLCFETEILDKENYQGNAVINYTDKAVSYTRIIEHKHFEFGQQKHTVVTKEYPANFNHDNDPYYPVNDKYNNRTFLNYQRLANNQEKYQFGGRLGNYSYYDMDDTIEAAMNHTELEICKSIY